MKNIVYIILKKNIYIYFTMPDLNHRIDNMDNVLWLESMEGHVFN